jgi:hypothetical protein
VSTQLEWERRVLADPSLWGVRSCPVERQTEAGREVGMIPDDAPPWRVVAGLITRVYESPEAVQAAGWRLM